MFGDVTEKKLIFRGHLDQFEIVGCFYGVVCLSLLRRPQMYALWNPATGKFKEIGNAPIEGHFKKIWSSWYGSEFCFYPVTNAFKVAQIRLTVTEAAEETRAQVNVFSTATNSWTEKNFTVPYEIWFRGFSSIIRGVSCVNGYLHWHIGVCRDVRTSEVTFKLEDMYILSYNIIDEVFQRIEMPFCAPTPMGYYHLAQYNGSLAMFVHEEHTGPVNSFSEVDVWVLNDCGDGANHSWSKLLTCKPSVKVRLAVGFFKKDDVDLVLFYGEPDNSLYLFYPEAGTTQKFCENNFGMHTFLYSESLASLN